MSRVSTVLNDLVSSVITTLEGKFLVDLSDLSKTLT